jgi:ferredoxin
MTVTLGADRGRCCGSGLCWEIAPDFFDIDDDGIVVLLQHTAIDESHREILATAVKTCPSGAIYVQDERT